MNPSRRRRWLVPAFAAVAAVLLTGGVAMMWDDGPGDPATATGPPASDPVFADGRVPPVFGYGASSAEEMLTEHGLAVTRKPTYTCRTPDRAVRTQPGAGTRFEPGDRVTLFVTEPPLAARCALPAGDALAWQLLDYANGRGRAPVFASQVNVVLDGQPTTVTGEEAADLDSWSPDSALGVLAAASRQQERRHGDTVTPTLSAYTTGGTPLGCERDVPRELMGRQSVSVDISFPVDGPFLTCPIASIYQTQGQIDAIVVRTPEALTDPVPEPDPDPDGIGASFLAYARGDSDELPAAPSVRLYLGSEYQTAIGAEDVDDRGSWALCAPYAERSCPMSAVTTLREFDTRPAVTDFLPDGCVDELAEEPTDTGGTRMVALGVPEPATCADDFVVQIWSNDAGQITAVNLLFGSP